MREEGRNLKKTSVGSSSVGKRAGARTEASAAVRKQLINAKRRKNDDDITLSAPALSGEEVVALVVRCKTEGVVALRELRRALANDNELIIQHALDAGIIEIVLTVLQGTCVDSQLEAAWTITNVAAGTSAQTEAALATAPCLVQLLLSGSAAVQEQCVWALGNMAGDNPDFRDRIRANGAGLPTVQLLESTNVAVRTTAAWALSNFARGPEPKLQELFAVGAGERAVDVVVASGGRVEVEGVLGGAPLTLLIELSWLLSFLTYNQEAFQLRLLASGCLAGLVTLLQTPDDQLRIPILRTIGNLVCGADEIVDGLLAHPLALQTLYQLLQAEHKGLIKETCWTISNIAAGSAQHRAALMHANFAPLLLHILQNAHFDIRKEAGFALFHLLMDPVCREHILSPDIAVEYVGLLRAPDAQVVDIALSVVEMVLAEVPGGARVVEEAEGIDALEQLVYANAGEALVARASVLVDKYFGEDAEPY